MYLKTTLSVSYVCVFVPVSVSVSVSVSLSLSVCVCVHVYLFLFLSLSVCVYVYVCVRTCIGIFGIGSSAGGAEDDDVLLSWKAHAVCTLILVYGRGGGLDLTDRDSVDACLCGGEFVCVCVVVFVHVC